MRSNKLGFATLIPPLVVAFLCQGVSGALAENYTITATGFGGGLMIVDDPTKAGTGLRFEAELKSIVLPSNILWAVGFDFIDYKSRDSDDRASSLSPDSVKVTLSMLDVYGQLGLCLHNSNFLVLDCYGIAGINLIITSWSEEDRARCSINQPDFLYGGGIGLDIFYKQNRAITIDALYLDTAENRMGSYGFAVGMTWYH